MDFIARAILHTDDAIPENYVQNQFAMYTVDDTPPDTDGVTAAIKDFYDALGSYLGGAVAQNGHQVKFYEMPGLTPNYPFAETTFNLASNPTGGNAPSEVAIVLSFQGVRAAGNPQARRRGRIYLGPLQGGTIDSSGRPTSGVITALATAGSTFGGDIAALEDHAWAVWSTVDQQMVPIADGWVDNAFDTQRRRGLAATSRTTWAVP